MLADQLIYGNWSSLRKNKPIICNQTSTLEQRSVGVWHVCHFSKTCYDNHLLPKSSSCPSRKETSTYTLSIGWTQISLSTCVTALSESCSESEPGCSLIKYLFYVFSLSYKILPNTASGLQLLEPRYQPPYTSQASLLHRQGAASCGCALPAIVFTAAGMEGAPQSVGTVLYFAEPAVKESQGPPKMTFGKIFNIKQ